jgi:ATP-dependent Clp protease ATP-binding subunit ClpB
MAFSDLLIHALQQQSIGQEYAISALARSATMAAAGMRSPDRPLAVLLFLGPTSSGKTHLAKAFARVLLGDERRMLQAHCHQVRSSDPLANLRLLVADLQTGALSRTAPAAFSIVLLEGIDEAPAVLRDSLATAFERGEIIAPAAYLSLRNSFVILTARLSKKKADQLIGRPIGFFRVNASGAPLVHREAIPLEEMDHMFGPRLVSNVDEIIIFDRPNQQNLLALFERRLAEVELWLARHSIGLMIDQDAKTFLVRGALDDPVHGMRQLNRAVKNFLEFPLADLMLSGNIVPGTTVMVGHESPRNFLNFKVLIPSLQFGQPYVADANALSTSNAVR